jgi:thiol reductant ABC exporter CydC subunit
MTRLVAGERWRLGLGIALAVGAAGAAIALLATSGYLISRAAERPPVLALLTTIVAVRAFGLMRAGLRYAERLASHDFALRVLARLRTGIYARLVPLAPGRLAGRSGGDLLARFVADVDMLQDVFLRGVIPIAVAAAVVAGAAVAAGIILGAAGLVVLAALGAAAVVVPWASGRIAARSARRQAPARARLTERLVEAIDGAPELAMAGRGADFAAGLRSADTELAGIARRDAAASATASASGALLAGAGLTAVLVVGIPAVRSGALPGVLLAALAFLFLAASESLAPLPAAARRLRACAVAHRRVAEVCEGDVAVYDPAEPLERPAGGALLLDDVRLAYDDPSRPVLDGVTLRVEPGATVGILGPSGTGKTSLAELLVRLRDPDAGVVRLGGVDVRRLRQHDLRAAVLLSGQDAHVFTTTLRENLLLAGRDATDEDLWRALAAVELQAWAERLPDGLDTFIGQDGGLVSGGQRQRIALARVMLSRAAFLILDEPTAHLEGDLRRRVLGHVLAGARERGCGVIVISHQPDDLAGLDEVHELRDGALAPAGSPSRPLAIR